MNRLSNTCSSNIQSPDLSIIIVNWNTEELTRQCIRSIYDTLHDITFEVWVVDNNSSDGSVDMIKKEFQKVSLIENSRNEGFARANNQALKIIAGKYALLLNSDTIVLGNALSKMKEFMDAHQHVGVLGCKLLDKNSNLQLSAAWFHSLWSLIFGGDVLPLALSRILRLKRFPGQCFLNETQHAILQEVDWVVGACMWVRVSVLCTAGLLDENLFMYGEEIEWCYRIKKAGWSVMYFPDAQIFHLGGGSGNAGSQEPMSRSIFAQRYVFHKHHGLISSSIYDCLKFLSSLAKIVIWGVVAVVFPRRHLARVHLRYHRMVLKSLLLPLDASEASSSGI